MSISCGCLRGWPNPLVELTRYGIAPGPRGVLVYHPPRGPGAMPPRAAHRERSQCLLLLF
jgi:hypothetical protein